MDRKKHDNLFYEILGKTSFSNLESTQHVLRCFNESFLWVHILIIVFHNNDGFMTQSDPFFLKAINLICSCKMRV